MFWVIFFAIACIALASCGSSGCEQPAPKPTELWPAGLYRCSSVWGDLYISVASDSIQVGPGATQWEWAPKGGWCVEGRSKIDNKWVNFTLHPAGNCTFSYPPITWRGRAVLVTSNG